MFVYIQRKVVYFKRFCLLLEDNFKLTRTISPIDTIPGYNCGNIVLVLAIFNAGAYWTFKTILYIICPYSPPVH